MADGESLITGGQFFIEIAGKCMYLMYVLWIRHIFFSSDAVFW